MTDDERMTRVYGHTTWDVYTELDVSLQPEGPDSMVDLAGSLLVPGALVVDVGCRDGAHLIELVRRFDVDGVGCDPVAIHIERARDAVERAGLQNRIALHQSTAEELPRPVRKANLVWCRDVLEQVGDLDAVLATLVELAQAGAPALVFTVVATDQLLPSDRALLGRHIANVDTNLDRARVEGAFTAAGLVIEQIDVVGTRWREHGEERHQPVSRALLRLARLRRRRAELTAHHGADVIGHVEANLHWELFQFLGKLEPILYLLRTPSNRR
jgi:cyclopropane fatty-acyl-phospholipid synthase-like methyltransferase